jgi:hypothetical protein
MYWTVALNLRHINILEIRSSMLIACLLKNIHFTTNGDFLKN